MDFDVLAEKWQKEMLLKIVLWYNLQNLQALLIGMIRKKGKSK